MMLKSQNYLLMFIILGVKQCCNEDLGRFWRSEEFIIGWEPVVYPESSYKIMDPVSATLTQNLRRIFVATLV